MRVRRLDVGDFNFRKMEVIGKVRLEGKYIELGRIIYGYKRSEVSREIFRIWNIRNLWR